MREDVFKLRFEVRALAESYNPIIPLVIPPISQPLPTAPSLVFDLFTNEDEPPNNRDKRT